MKRLVTYLTIVVLAVSLWGCPAGQNEVVWGEAIYTPHSAEGFEIVATEGASTVLRILTPWPAAKGVVKEVTAASPHRQHMLDINYMSTHPDSYPQLKGNDTARNEIETYELPYRNKATSYIPKEKLHLDSKRLDIRNGDIIALVTTIKGLDVSHVGFAFWDGDSLHMMHASSKEKAVIRDKHTLYRYQKNNKSQTGIRVIRILPETLK